MRHITYSDKELFVDDAAADWLVRYAAALAGTGGADSVTLRAVGVDGNEVEATLVLGPHTELVSETASATLALPGNDEAVAYMRAEIEKIESPPRVHPAHPPVSESEASAVDEI